MGLIEKLSRFFSNSSGGEKGVYWISVRCKSCGEIINARVNLYNDLSIVYDNVQEPTYICRKTLVGSQGCYQRIEVELVFDSKRRLLGSEIVGGTFIEQD
jgi:DNA-directed RNA polymerase subunit N (RpoN/RPB10)